MQALNRDIKSVLDENQIYHIDHYLGKETVQNILVFAIRERLPLTPHVARPVPGREPSTMLFESAMLIRRRDITV